VATYLYSRKARAPNEKPLSETYLPIDRQKVDDLSNAPDAVTRFVNARSASAPLSPTTYLVAYRMAPSERVIPDGTVQFINDLLMVSSNDVYVPPTILFSEEDSRGQEQRASIYLSLLRRILQTKASSTHGRVVPGIVVPKFLAYSGMSSLFDAFHGEEVFPSFVSIDFGNSRISDHGVQQKLAWVHRFYRSRKTRNYFIHGLRVRPRKRGMIPADAEDMASFLSGVDSIGPVRRSAPATIPSFDWDSLVAFGRRAYSYDLVSQSRDGGDLRDFLEANGIEPPVLSRRPTKRDAPYLSHTRDFNRYSVNSEGMRLFELALNRDSEGIRRLLSGKRGVGVAGQVRERAAEGFLGDTA
jgi:hypothetical protein